MDELIDEGYNCDWGKKHGERIDWGEGELI